MYYYQHQTIYKRDVGMRMTVQQMKPNSYTHHALPECQNQTRPRPKITSNAKNPFSAMVYPETLSTPHPLHGCLKQWHPRPKPRCRAERKAKAKAKTKTKQPNQCIRISFPLLDPIPKANPSYPTRETIQIQENWPKNVQTVIWPVEYPSNSEPRTCSKASRRSIHHRSWSVQFPNRKNKVSSKVKYAKTNRRRRRSQ